MQGSITLIGLDVHASRTAAAVLDVATGEVRHSTLRMAPVQVAEWLARWPGRVLVVYEAGPTGFGLARRAAELGVEVRVVAAGLVPRGSGDRVKTDRRDAERLVRLLAAGELRFAFVPTIADEQFRDVIRAIEDCRGDLMRCRHRLGKFLLRRDVRWNGPGSAWTQNHLRWLRGLRFEDPCSRAVFADYLAGVELLQTRKATLVGALEDIIPASSHAPAIAALRCFRGIDTLSAAGLCAEVGDWRRFPRPKHVSGFFGIVPAEHTSGDKRRQGSITKAGSQHGRRLLVEAAHHYHHRPAIGTTLARRQHGQDPRVIEVAWRAQVRLYQRWTVLRGERHKPAGVVAIACARELAAFCWEAALID